VLALSFEQWEHLTGFLKLASSPTIIAHDTSQNTYLWPATGAAIGLVIALIAPPAFWLCGVGGTLFAVVVSVNSVRSGEWSYWPGRSNGGKPMTEGEVAAGLTAASLMAMPLLVVIARSLAI
jgi:hypothetical protein